LTLLESLQELLRSKQSTLAETSRQIEIVGARVRDANIALVEATASDITDLQIRIIELQNIQPETIQPESNNNLRNALIIGAILLIL